MKEYYKVKKVSNSSLSWFQQSPKYFKLMLDKEIEEESKSYFEKGEQTHQYILEPEEFDNNYVFLDYEQPKSSQQREFCESFARAKKGSADEKALAAYKKAYSTKENDEKILEKARELTKTYDSYIKYIKLSTTQKTVLSNSMHQQLNESRKALISHDKASELVFNERLKLSAELRGDSNIAFTANEFEIYWKYPNTEVECKSMIDRIIIDHENKKITLVDLKTSSHISEFREKFFEYKYYRQMAFYWMAIYWHFKNVLTDKNFDDYTKETFIVVIGTKDPIEVKVFEITEKTLNLGILEIDPLMRQLEWHFKENKWDYTKEYYEGITTEQL